MPKWTPEGKQLPEEVEGISEVDIPSDEPSESRYDSVPVKKRVSRKERKRLSDEKKGAE